MTGQKVPKTARAAAIVTWVYAAGFGIPAIPIGVRALRTGDLPWFFGQFPMYGGPWSAAVGWKAFAGRLTAFSVLMLVVGWAGWLLWRGRRSGAILTAASLPLEAVFWWGFALPVPVISGVVRVVLTAIAWPRLRRRARAGS